MAVTDRQRRIGKGRYQWVGRWVAAMWWSHLEHEWHAVPPWVVHVQDGGRECLRPRPLVPDFGIGAVAVVLAHHEIVQCHWAACVEHLELLLADVLGREVERLLHRHQRHHLRRGGGGTQWARAWPGSLAQHPHLRPDGQTRRGRWRTGRHTHKRAHL